MSDIIYGLSLGDGAVSRPLDARQGIVRVRRGGGAQDILPKRNLQLICLLNSELEEHHKSTSRPIWSVKASLGLRFGEFCQLVVATLAT